MCLIFFIDYGSLVSPIPSRLSSRYGVPWGVLFFLSGLLIACSYCFSYSSRRASRSLRLVSSSRLACLSRCSYLRFLVGVSFYSVPPFLRLVISSCRGVLLARLVFLSICLIVLMVCDEMFLRRRRVIHIITMVMRLVPLRLAARSLLARYETIVRCPCPSCVIRS